MQNHRRHQIKSRQKGRGARTAAGASLILVIFCALGLIALVWGVFQLYLVLGGSREVRNAVDAGALNLSKRVFELRVPTDGVYGDVADSNGQIGMSNINRVWGKAYLINANVQQMQADGQLGDAAQGNAEAAYQSAENINNTLFAAVTCRNSQGALFNQVAGFKQAKLLSGDTTVTKDANATTQESPLASIAMVDRGAESNLSFSPTQIPKVVQAQGVQQGGKSYLTGFVPMQANNKQFSFTAFRNGEMPHLISQNIFDQCRADKSPVGGTNVIPNAFKIDGSVQATQGSLGAVACAVANPQRQYRLAIPHSYIRIFFTNQAMWFVEGVKVNQTPYGNKPDQQTGVKKKKLSNGGLLTGFAKLGNEYQPGGSLWQMYTALPGDHMTPMQKVLQRVQEIDPDYTLTRLQAQMEACNSNPAAQSYLIYATYNTPDCSDPTIHIQPDNGSLPPWLQNLPIDGTALAVGAETMTKDAPNTCTDYIEGPIPTDKHYTECSGSIIWTPGSGYTQCLGTMHVSRVTAIYFTGKP
jgi:hypothetical protein